MKFITKFLLPCMLALAMAMPVQADINDRFATSQVEPSRNPMVYSVRLNEISAPSGNPATNRGWLYVKDNSGTSDLYFEDDAGTVTELTASGSATAYDDIGDPDANGSITMAGYTNTWTSTLDNGSVFKIDNTDADLSNDTVLIELEFTDNGDANGIFLQCDDNNADTMFSIGANGLTTITGVAEGTDALVLTAGDITVTDGDVTLSSGDLLITGTTFFEGVMQLDNGLRIDNASNNVLEINENSEELKLTFASNVLDISSTSGLNQVDFFDGDASSLTKAADGAADDFTISVTGAQDSSLVLSSAGTGADAMSLSTSAGGIDITVSGGAAGEDIDLSTDTSINLSATENAASAITLVSNGGASETIVITNTQGTGDAAIDINGTAGGIDIDAAKSVAIASSENTADSVSIVSSAGGIDISASGAAAGEDVDITATGSSVNITSTEAAADAVVISASTAAGGIDITSNADIDITTTGASGEDITITNTGGSIAISATEAAADAITITTNGGAAEQMVITNTQGTNDAAIDINGTAGGVDIDAAGPIGITSSEDTVDSVVISSATGGIDILASAAGAADDIDIANTGGSVNISASEADAAAVVINASAGGVDISSAATYDIDITATGGKILGVASEAAADQFKIDAQGVVAGNAINLETTDGGVLVNADGGTNGDIELNSADDMTLTSAGDLTLAVTGTISAGGSAITNILKDAEAVSAANVITATECGNTFFIGDATEFQSTLPALSGVSAGCEMTFVVTAAPVGASYTVVTGASLENQIYGLVVVNGASVQAATEDTITFADGAAAVGDWCTVESDGTSWYVRGQGHAAGAITLTQAD